MRDVDHKKDEKTNIKTNVFKKLFKTKFIPEWQDLRDAEQGSLLDALGLGPEQRLHFERLHYAVKYVRPPSPQPPSQPIRPRIWSSRLRLVLVQ